MTHRIGNIRSTITATDAGGKNGSAEGNDGADGEAATPNSKPKSSKAPRSTKTPRTPKAGKHVSADDDTSPVNAAVKRKARANKKDAATTDMEAANGVTENEDAGEQDEEEDGSPAKKAKKARTPRKKGGAAKNAKAEAIKREEGTGMELGEMGFEMEEDNVKDGDFSDGAGGVGIKDEEE